MSTKTIIYIIVTWVAINIIVPLFVNSLDRLYRKRVDSMVVRSVSLSRRLFFFVVRILLTLMLCATQILLIILMLPTMIWIPVAERFYPQIFEKEIAGVKAYADQRYIAKLAITTDLWNVVFGQMRKHKHKDENTV